MISIVGLSGFTVTLCKVLKIAGQEYPDRHRPTEGIKQWMAPAVDTQLNQLFHTHFHHEEQ